MPVTVHVCGRPGPATKAALVDMARRVTAPASAKEAEARKLARDYQVAHRAMQMNKGDRTAASTDLRVAADRMERMRNPAPAWVARVERLRRAADILDRERS